MEMIRGKNNLHIDAAAFNALTRNYAHTWIDLGTGDGQFVIHTARQHSDQLILGIDACRENLVKTSRCAPGNALFLIANALALPAELDGTARHITINFPWGSLLQGLLHSTPELMQGLTRIALPGAVFEVRLNDSALQEAGWDLEQGSRQVRENLLAAGLRVKAPAIIQASELRRCPTSWAKRLAFGRQPRAAYLLAV